MLQLLTCSRGHFWESTDQEASPRCPECGAPADPLGSPDLAPCPEPAPVAAASAPIEQLGRPVIPGYEILEELPRDATGFRRFRAKQPLIGREVQLDVVLAREDSTQRGWSRLRSEAGLLGKLTHPHILAIHDAGERDRQLFYNAVEHVAGPTLAQKIANEPVPIPQAIYLVEMLALAIDHAHRRDVLHRHLEPAVILLQPVGETRGGAVCLLHSGAYIPRIAGFGLARRPVEGDPTDAELYAEPGFLSPEQAWGRTKELGPPTDVYGLGGILYALLTGRPPFRGPTLGDVLDAVQTAKLSQPSAYRPVPEDVEWVCYKALERRPNARYPTAREMADDLAQVGRGYAPASRHVGIPGRIARWIRRG